LKIYYIIWIQNCAKYWVTRPGLRFGLFWWGSRRLTYWKRFNINRRDKIWVNILVSQLCFLMAFQWDRIRHRLNPISPYFTQANYIIFAISQANLRKLAGAPGGCAPGPLLQISLNSQGRIWTSGNRRQICPAKQVTGLFQATLSTSLALHPLLMQYHEPRKVAKFDTPSDRRGAACTCSNASWYSDQQ
jgi:hypothetical protein